MSTDIVHWDTGTDGRSERKFSMDALGVYLASTLPLMVATFACWYGVHWRVNLSGKEGIHRRFYAFRRPPRLTKTGTV